MLMKTNNSEIHKFIDGRKVRSPKCEDNGNRALGASNSVS